MKHRGKKKHRHKTILFGKGYTCVATSSTRRFLFLSHARQNNWMLINWSRGHFFLIGNQEGMITRCWLSLWFIDFNLTKWSRVTLSTRASYRKTLKIQVKSILKCPRAYFITYANRRVTVLSMLTEYRAIFLFVWFLGENNWYLDDSEWGLEKEHHSDSCVGWKLSKEKRRSQAHRRVLTIFFWEL